MSKKILLDAFFNQYESFLNDLMQVFPDDTDFPLYLTGLAMFRRTNPSFVVQTTWTHISKFEEILRTRDETFFVQHEYKEITEGDPPLEQTITKLKGLWSSLDSTNKTIVWDYVNNICRLAKACSEA